MTDLFDAVEVRIVRRSDGGLEIDLHLKGDDRALAYLIVHEDASAKLYRKFDLSLQAREDPRTRKDFWYSRLVRVTARVLR